MAPNNNACVSPEISVGAVLTLEECERRFRYAPSVRLTDDVIRHPLLGYAIENSLRAATSQGALLTQLSEESRKKLNESVRDDLACALLTSFLEVKPGMDKDSYRKWHGGLCESLCTIAEGLKDDDGNPCWTYGNSQKAVNLAVKYLVHIAKAAREIGTENEASRIGEVFLAIEKDLDIPVDSRIIKASQSHNEKEAKKLILPLSPKKGSGKPSSGKVICWSKWEKSDYEAYSCSLHEAFERPFEWEERVWIRRD